MLEINSGSGTAGTSFVNVDDNVEGKTSGQAKVTGEREREGGRHSDVYLTLSQGQLHTDCVSKSEFEYAYGFAFDCLCFCFCARGVCLINGYHVAHDKC